MEDTPKKYSNDGCTIAGIVIFIIVSLIFAFQDSEKVAGIGQFVLMIAGFVAAYFVIKAVASFLNESAASSSTEREPQKVTKNYSKSGCKIILICGICGIGVIYGFLNFSENFEVSFTIGAIAVIAIIVSFAFYMFAIIEDEN